MIIHTASRERHNVDALYVKKKEGKQLIRSDFAVCAIKRKIQVQKFEKKKTKQSTTTCRNLKTVQKKTADKKEV